VGRIEDGGGDDGEPVRSPLGRSRSDRLSMRGGWNAQSAARFGRPLRALRSAGFSIVATVMPGCQPRTSSGCWRSRVTPRKA